MCDTYYYDYLKHTTFRFNLIDFQFNTDFPSQFCVFNNNNNNNSNNNNNNWHLYSALRRTQRLT